MKMLKTWFKGEPSKLVSKQLNNEGGFALIVVIGILFLVTLIAVASFSTSDADRRIASNNLENNQAFYAAEAGVNRALGMLYDSTWRTGFANASLGKTSYSVLVIDSLTQPALKDSLLLQANGSSDGMESVIEVLLAKKRSQVFKQGTFGDSAVNVGGNALIDAYNSDSGSYAPGGMGGDVGSNGHIHVGGNADIYGNVSTPDTITTNGSMNIYGTKNNSASEVNLELITQADLDYARINSDALTAMTLVGGAAYNPVTKSLSASGGGAQIILTGGLYFFSTISLTSGSQLIIPSGAEVVIFMSGNLNASGGTVVNTNNKPKDLQIYSTGTSLDVTGNASIYAAIYAPKAEIKVAGNGTVYGSLVGFTIKNTGNGAVHFDRALFDIESPLKAKYKAVAWQVL